MTKLLDRRARVTAIALAVLFAACVSLPAQISQVPDPWCQAHRGDRIILGQFPYFSCVERGADCALHPSLCTSSEIAMIVFMGGQFQQTVAPQARNRPTPAKRRQP
jgi:hypothetical protein